MCLFPVLIRYLRPQWLSAQSLLLLSFLGLILYYPQAVEGRFMKMLILPRETRIEYEFLAKIGHRRLLVVADRSGQFTSHLYGAVNFNYFNRNSQLLTNELGRGLYEEIFVFQLVAFKTKQPRHALKLTKGASLQKISEHQISEKDSLRISRVKIELPKVKE
jgi:hypothetical protein